MGAKGKAQAELRLVEFRRRRRLRFWCVEVKQEKVGKKRERFMMRKEKSDYKALDLIFVQTVSTWAHLFPRLMEFGLRPGEPLPIIVNSVLGSVFVAWNQK